MIAIKILRVLLLLLGSLFILLQGLEYEVEAAAVSSSMLVLLTILYCGWTAHKSKYFFWFLVTFTVAHVLSYSSYYGPILEEGETDYFYYGTNLLYILSYIFLIIKLTKPLEFRRVFSELTAPVFILIVLSVFSVTLVTATTENVLSIYEYSLEFIYNAVIMTLLSSALINYMYRNDYKSMLFLIASVFIVFSEIIQLAYYYIVKDKNLGFIYSFFLVAAFFFLYLQSQKEFTGPGPTFNDGQLEV